MDVLEQLRKFHETVMDDPRIGVSHIAIYLALVLKWNGDIEAPIEIARVEIMSASKILARHTYNKCMNELKQAGYITYIASNSQFNPGIVYIRKL